MITCLHVYVCKYNVNEFEIVKYVTSGKILQYVVNEVELKARNVH
jgi:hypothetical protein